MFGRRNEPLAARSVVLATGCSNHSAITPFFNHDRTGRFVICFRTFLTSLKFIMPAMSWSASMYYGCHLLVEGRIDLQTIFM